MKGSGDVGGRSRATYREGSEADRITTKDPPSIPELVRAYTPSATTAHPAHLFPVLGISLSAWFYDGRRLLRYGPTTRHFWITGV